MNDDVQKLAAILLEVLDELAPLQPPATERAIRRQMYAIIELFPNVQEHCISSEYQVPPGVDTDVEAKPGAGAGQEAEKALSLSPQLPPCTCETCEEIENCSKKCAGDLLT